MAYTTIDDPSAYFKVQLWAGDDESSRAIAFDDTDTTMQPDFVWIKARAGDEATGSHQLYDSVRGATKYLKSHETGAEGTFTNGLTAFGSDGFTVGDHGEVNDDGTTYVAWCWKAGTTSGITTNGDTDVTPSGYSFDQTSGVSIVKWSSAAGQTAHGLGKKPQFIFTKRTDATGSWKTYHEVADATDFIKISDNAAREDNDTVWGDTEPDTVNFTVGSAFGSSDDYIGYCFASIQGFSKFGSYTGNGNADGTFVYTGFQPAWIMTKRIDSTGDWLMYDSKREGYNVDNDYIKSNANSAEQADVDIDILSNGFKIRNTAGDQNASGGTYIYAAFAEQPFVNSEGVPATAR